ncbi:17.6 kDa class I heat shock protein 2 [Carica papaya]|uniref:17.6 kDa class I heat shock protein 2 n=1 Tax=Carica papaya TaxID=3649 RepID=UPI000B8CB043|nr:17.6 kDa class I heat shock protein 2 [Carica papaya]
MFRLMTSKAAPSRSYEEFEPLCKWQTSGEEQDILEVHLPGFTKDQLKVQINNHGVLTITGERPVTEDRSRWSRFRKEAKVQRDCKTNGIRAKFSGGILYIIMPKTPPSPPPPSDQEVKNQARTNSGVTPGGQEEEDGSRGGVERSGLKEGVCSRFKNMNKKKGLKASMAVVLLVTIAVGAYFTYKICYDQISSVDS